MTNPEWDWAGSLCTLANSINDTMATIEANGGKSDQFLAIALAHVFQQKAEPFSELREVYEQAYNVLAEESGTDPSEQPTPEHIEGVRAIMSKVDDVVNENCATLHDQIGLLLTHILIRVAKMAKREKINPKREIDRIGIAMKKEWRMYQQLVDKQPSVH